MCLLRIHRGYFVVVLMLVLKLSGIENKFIENKVKVLRNTLECVAKVTIRKVVS